MVMEEDTNIMVMEEVSDMHVHSCMAMCIYKGGGSDVNTIH